jgi:signal transduction histidine kinase
VKSPDGWRRYSTADGLPSNDVNTLFEDFAGTLWIGTAAGLAAMHEGRMQSLTAVPALLRASVLGLAEDRAGGLWIAATDHVLRVNREKLLRGTLGAGDLREFSAADGLLDMEVIKRHRILTADSHGRIWLSTNGGLVSADSRRVAAGIAPALVQVEGVSADGSPVEGTRAMTIPPRPDRITFGFAALSLSVPDRVRFRYRLDGFDHDWSEPVAERQAVFTNLGPGTYRFRVIASNSDGVWNSAEAALPFTIAPAWWQMRSFWAAVGFLMAGGIWGGYRRRLQQLARQLDVRFEERLAERSRIARELHDTLLQSFQGAILRFRAVTYMLPDRPADARATLENAIDHARQAIVEGRDAVQGLRSSATGTNDVAVAIATLAETLSTDDESQSSPVFHVNVEGTPRDLPPIVQDEVYRIAGEALRNAFRHAHASRIEVEIRYDQRSFRLRVRDDGKGIDAEVAGGRTYDGHYGMAGMHERAKLLGGTLSVWSERDSGTEAELTIPSSVAYSKTAAV